MLDKNAGDYRICVENRYGEWVGRMGGSVSKVDMMDLEDER